jgi:DNA mismatch repair protein MutS2
VNVEDLVPATGGGNESGVGSRRPTADGVTSASRLQLSRARTVASSLDVRGARVDEALDAVGRYLDDAALAGLEKVTIIHGHGTGALRDAVRSQAGQHPLVKEVRAGERGEGGDGATVVSL